MPRVPLVEAEALGSRLGDLWEFSRTNYGLIPNSFLVLAHRPALADAAARLARVIMQEPGTTSIELRWMVGHVTSRAAACRYCSAHTAHFATELGSILPEKLDALWEFESSPLFNDAERAALRVALAAGVTPNAVTDEMFSDLRRHYSDEQAVEIVSVIALFGFFNRWNDTMANEIEQSPLAAARQHLSGTGWYPEDVT